MAGGIGRQYRGEQIHPADLRPVPSLFLAGYLANGDPDLTRELADDPARQLATLEDLRAAYAAHERRVLEQFAASPEGEHPAMALARARAEQRVRTSGETERDPAARKRPRYRVKPTSIDVARAGHFAARAVAATWERRRSRIDTAGELYGRHALRAAIAQAVREADAAGETLEQWFGPGFDAWPHRRLAERSAAWLERHGGRRRHAFDAVASVDAGDLAANAPSSVRLGAVLGELEGASDPSAPGRENAAPGGPRNGRNNHVRDSRSTPVVVPPLAPPPPRRRHRLLRKWLAAGLLADPPPFALKCLRAVSECGPKGVRAAYAGRATAAERRRCVRMVRSLTTDGGTARAVRVAQCGLPVARARLSSGAAEVAYAPLACRDRACIACMRSRGVQVKHALRAHHAARLLAAPDVPRLFVTLTQPKWSATFESPGGAYDRLVAAWSRFRESHWFRENVLGGVRAIENKWSTKGGIAGWHAHIHAAIELAPGASRFEFLARWESSVRSVSGRVSSLAQHVADLDDRRIGELAKYVTKPFELPDERAVEFFRDMAGVRLIDGFGTWRAWRQAVERPSCAGWLVGPSLGEVQDVAARDGWVDFYAAVSDRSSRLRRDLEQTAGEWRSVAEMLPDDPLHRRGTFYFPIASMRARDVLRSVRLNPSRAWDRPSPELALLRGGAGPPGDVPVVPIARPMQERDGVIPVECRPLLLDVPPTTAVRTLQEIIRGERFAIGRPLKLSERYPEIAEVSGG